MNLPPHIANFTLTAGANEPQAILFADFSELLSLLIRILNDIVIKLLKAEGGKTALCPVANVIENISTVRLFSFKPTCKTTGTANKKTS